MENTEKQNIRAEMKALLAGLDPVSKAFESMNTCMKVIQSRFFEEADYVFGFMPMRDEVDVLPVMRAAMNSGKKVMIPKVLDDGRMEFSFVADDPVRDTVAGAYGIWEPREDLEKCIPGKIPSGSNILVLVPGLAFGADCTRLGRGKGFYDRFLSELRSLFPRKCLSFMGICFQVQVRETVPHDENDVRVDHLPVFM